MIYILLIKTANQITEFAVSGFAVDAAGF